jgi:hypothetical protein
LQPRRVSAIGLLLAGSLCLLPFLIPYHQQPIASFYPEWLSVALGVGAASAAFFTRSGCTPWPILSRWLAAFALFFGLTAVFGRPVYAQLPLIAALYVFAAALAIWLGAHLGTTHGVDTAATTLAAFVLVGALANAAAGVIQFYGRPAFLEDIVAELIGNRAYGNIAQANLYANYLAVGEGALVLLWVRGSVRAPYAFPALVLLAFGGALSGSRSALLYSIWFAVLGLIAARSGHEATLRMKSTAFVVAGATLTAHIAVPWLNDLLALGPSGGGALARTLEGGEPRWQVWQIALRLFAGAPIVGIGAGRFSGAAFESGLGGEISRDGEVWTSPHNLLLHLLAETGAVGTILVTAGLCLWISQVARRYRADPQPAMWWIIAVAGVELIHSFVEFPIWSAHFLLLTALIMGAGVAVEAGSPTAPRLYRISVPIVCAILAMALGVTLRDYLRLDAARITGTSPLTLAPAAQVRRDAATMRELATGIMAPIAEAWIFLGTPLDRDHLASKLAMSERVAGYWPSPAVVARRAALLALDGHSEEAKLLLDRALRTFRGQVSSITVVLEQARVADSGAIDPLLRMTRAASALHD